MASNKNINNTIPSTAENPFNVPVGYFDNLQDRVMENIRKEEAIIEQPNPKKIYLRTYLALVASISGLALIVYVILQSVLGPQTEESTYYDLAFLDKAGIILDESVVAETYTNSEEDTYTEWEEGAMTYLSSNEVDLIHLLESY